MMQKPVTGQDVTCPCSRPDGYDRGAAGLDLERDIELIDEFGSQQVLVGRVATRACSQRTGALMEHGRSKRGL